MTVKNDEPEVKSGFFRRWSNRKIESQSEDTNVNEIENVASANNQSVQELEIQSDSQQAEVQEHKTDADMPPIEELTEESNFSDFLSPKVSEVLRKQALRKLFHLPFMNVVDGLDDYAEDFTKFEKLGDIIPHEMKRMLEREKAKELNEKELKEKEQQDIKDADDLRADGLQDIESESDELDDDADFDEEYENDEDIQLANMNTNAHDTLSTDELINLKDKHENEKLN